MITPRWRSSRRLNIRTSASASAPPRRRHRPLPRLTVGAAGGQLVGGADERLAEREVEVHGSGVGPGGGEDGAGGERSPRAAGRPVGHAGRWNQRTAVPYKTVLVDRLGGTHVVQLRRAVRGAHQHRHARQIRLGDGAVEGVAAVPLVHNSTAGAPEASPTPRAANARTARRGTRRRGAPAVR